MVYEAIRDPPLQFETGDVLGIYNPTIPALNLMYQKQGGPLNHYIAGPITAPESIDLDGSIPVIMTNRNDYPLVSVEVNPPECASGFIDTDTLLRKASLLTVNSSDLEYREATQRLVNKKNLRVLIGGEEEEGEEGLVACVSLLSSTWMLS